MTPADGESSMSDIGNNILGLGVDFLEGRPRDIVTNVASIGVLYVLAEEFRTDLRVYFHMILSHLCLHC